MDFLQQELANNTLLNWLIAAAITLLVVIASSAVRYGLSSQFRRLEKRSEAPVWPTAVSVVSRTHWLFTLILGLYVGTLVLDIPHVSRNISNTIMIITLLMQAGIWVGAAVQMMIGQYQKKQMARDPASITTLNILSFITKFAIWVVVLLLILDNLGVNITALVAGLGIGGIAIALAVQNILGDLLASLSIVLDKPFSVGDFLLVGEMAGSVEHVGLKTTRLRSVSGEQLVISNSDLLASRIRNYGRMYERRGLFTLGVTYQTPHDKLVKIPQIIQETIEKQPNTRFDRSHFKEYGDFALLFETVYYVQSADYKEYMNTQQAINLEIHGRFEQENIEFAYPTQTLFVQKS